MHSIDNKTVNLFQHVFVVSDLHLVGSTGGDIISSSGKQRLASFLISVCNLARQDAVHLILNGDTVDFLSGKGALAFINDPQLARNRMLQIIQSNQTIFDALQDFINKISSKLTINLGNHDIELAYTSVTQLLFSRIDPSGQNRARIELRYGDEPITLGPILIEHGNNYDRWNRADYSALRKLNWIRRAQNIKDEVSFPLIPGSRLVVEVMNDIKANLPFIDLLKPEDDAVLPLLGVLKPSIIEKLQQIVNFYKIALRRDVNRIGKEISDILGNASEADEELLTAIRQVDDSFALAHYLTGKGELGNAGMGDAFPEFLKVWATVKHSDQRLVHLDRLLRSLQHLNGLNKHTFDTSVEHDNYLNAARRHISRGYRYVIFGHTHLPKRIKLTEEDGLYLNTGTWADVMSLPMEVLNSSPENAFVVLADFVDQLEQGQTPGRFQYPVFAWIRGNQGEEPTVDLYCFNSLVEQRLDAAAVRLADGPLHQMQEILK